MKKKNVYLIALLIILQFSFGQKNQKFRGGQNIVKVEFPLISALQYRTSNDENKQFCSGALSPICILTVTHSNDLFQPIVKIRLNSIDKYHSLNSTGGH